MRRIVIAAMFAGILACAGASYGAPGAKGIRDFSADIVTTDHGKEVSGKAFVAKGKLRMEMGGTVIITRLDKNRSWVFIPQERLYMEQPINRKFVTSTSVKFRNETGRELLGRETISGVTADKYKVTYTKSSGPASLFQWIAPDTGIPVRTAAADGSWSVEYRTIRPGPVDPELFEIPEGYAPAQMPALPVDRDAGIERDNDY